MNSLKKIKPYLFNLFTFIKNFFNVFFNLLLILIFRIRKSDNLKNLSLKHQILILANGPSLKNDYENYLRDNSFTENKDFLVLNEFARSNLYDIIKPNFYLFFDPIMFNDKSKDEVVNSIINENINNILNKTTWKMKLLIPNYAKNSKFVQKLSTSEFIDVVTFYNVPLFDSFFSINHFYYRFDFGNIPFRNSLVCAIFQSIRMNYSKIFLFGADHSWHESLKVSKNNILMRIDTHFYEKEVKESFKKNKLLSSVYKYRNYTHNNSDKPIKLHEEFFSIAKVLSVYHVLKKYSDFKKIKIINLSSKSWIDAFQRSIK